MIFAFVFSHPAWLWGLLLAAVPVAVHLLLRQRLRVEPWAAMRFLKLAVHRQRRRMQLKRWLQLLSRIAWVVCVILAVADLRTESPTVATSVNRPVHRLLILDVSFSMRTQQAGQSAFEKMRQVAQRILAQSFPGDSWQIVQHGHPDDAVIIREPSFEKEAVQKVLDELKPTWQPGNLTETLRIASNQLQHVPEDVETEVWYLSDLQRSEWQRGPTSVEELRESCRRICRHSRFVLVDCGFPGVSNFANSGLKFTDRAKRDSSLASLTASIERFSADTTASHLELIVDSRPTLQRLIPTGKERLIHIPLKVNMPLDEEHVVETSLPADALIEDNQRWLRVPAFRTVEVLLVNGIVAGEEAPATDFLKLAISPPHLHSTSPHSTTPSSGSGENRFRVVEVPENQFADAQLENFDVVILNNVANVTQNEAVNLAKDVQRGCGLLVIAGENVTGEAYEQQLGEGGVHLLPARLVGGIERLPADTHPYRFVPKLPQHPAIRLFANHPEAGLHASLVNRYQRVIPLEENASVERVIDLSNGDPLLMFRRIGAGTTGLITTAADETWGNWMLSPSFVPLIQQTLLFLASHQHQISESLLTQPVELPVLPGRFQWTIQKQDGTLKQGTSEWGHFAATEEPFSEPGVYEIRSDALLNGRHTIVRNIDPADSNLERITPAELTVQFFQHQRVEMTKDHKIQLSRSSTSAHHSGLATISRWLIMTALCLALCDLILGSAGSWAARGSGQRGGDAAKRNPDVTQT